MRLFASANQRTAAHDRCTRQGIYCFTADGKLLASRNAGQNPAVMREVLKEALAAFQRLPEEKRKPGAATVADVPQVDHGFVRPLPKGGLVLKVYTRILDRDELGGFCKGTCNVRGGDQASRDHVWLTEAEWKSLIPAQPKLFDRAAVSDGIAERIARFHLIDNTRGEPPMWQRRDVRSRKMNLTVTEVTADSVQMKLEGSVLLSSDADPERAARGFDVHLLDTYTTTPRRRRSRDSTSSPSAITGAEASIPATPGRAGRRWESHLSWQKATPPRTAYRRRRHGILTRIWV